MEKHARLNITLPQYLAKELTDVSIEMKNKKSRIIAKALELYFDELDVRIAENRLDEFGDDESTVPASEVWEKLGL
jgi:metal-responsive CopG/Arc/MetJ family transcriptional regulator